MGALRKTLAGAAALALAGCSKVVTVTHGADSGPGSLRAALAEATADPEVGRVRVEAEVDRIGLRGAATYGGRQHLVIEGRGAVLSPVTNEEFDLLVSEGGGGVALRDLTLRDAAGSALVVSIPAAASGSVRVVLSNVTIADNELFGVVVNDTNSSTASVDLEIASSTFTGNGRREGVSDIDAVRVNETGPGWIAATIRESRVSENGGDGVELDEAGSGGVKLEARDSWFDDNGDQDPDDLEDGLDIDETGEGSVLLRLVGVRVNRNFDEGIDLDEEGAGHLVARVVRTAANRNRSDGINLGEEGEGDLEAEVRRSTAAENHGVGVKGKQKGRGAGVLRLRHAALNGNRDGPYEAKGAEVIHRGVRR